jgi:hypothetical protein
MNFSGFSSGVLDMGDSHIPGSPYAPGERKEEKKDDKKDDKWSPELLAASVTIIIALLAAWQQSFRFFPTGTAVGIAAAITVVIAAILDRWLHEMRAVAQFFITLFTTLAVVLAVGFGLYWHETSPGRDARNAAAGWSAVNAPSESSGKLLRTAIKDQHGYGSGYEENGITYIHLDSDGSAIQPWLPSSTVSGTYYAQVTAKVSAGSTATACVLLFAYKNINSFFELSLRTDGLQLAYYDGEIPARAFEGPITVPYASDLGNWNTIAVLVSNSQVTGFVDDTQVFSDYVSQPLTGGIDFGTKDIGSGYDDDATCEFKNLEIRDSGD